MENIQAAARRKIGGDPRLGAGGTADRPWHVVIDDAADKFFDSFRAPSSDQGPQRPGEQGGRTGEAMFRTVLADQQVAAQVARETATQLKTAASMAAQFSGELGRFTTALKAQQDVERQRISDVLDRIERTFGGGGSGGGTGPSAAPRTTGGGAGSPRSTGGGSTRPAGPGRPAPPDMSHAKLSTHQAAAHRMSHGGLRRQILQQTGESYHQAYGQGTDQSPTVVAMRDANGQVTHYEERDGAGQLLSTTSVDDPLAPSMARRAMHALTVSRMAGALASGKGAGGILRAGAGGIVSGVSGSGAVAGGVGMAAKIGTRAIPFIGTAMMVGDAATSVLRFEQEQRAKNAYYQSIQGGSNAAGFGQRFQEEGFTWAEMFRGGLQDDAARQLFKGTSELGFKDSERSRMLQFGSQNYRQMGMGVDQSLKAIQIASSGANSSLAGVSKALTDVTKTARLTGQSADVMRDKFLGVMAVATSAGYGAAAPEVASILTQAGPGRGRDMAGVDYSGMFSETQQRLQAGQMGLSYGQLVAQNASGNVAPGLEAKDKQLKSAVQNTLSPAAKRMMDEKIKAAGGIEAVQNNPGLRRQIAIDVMNDPRSGMDPGIIKAMAGVYGVDLGEDPMAAGEWAVDQYSGGGAMGPKAKADEAAKQQRDMVDTDRPWDGSWGQSKFVGDNKASQLSKVDVFGWFTGEEKNKDKAVQAYADRQGSTGKVDPAIEAMITQLGGMSEVGIEVQTKDGPKVVSQSDAIKYYSDQVASGQATIVGGPADISGRKLGEVTQTTEGNYQGESSVGKSAQGDAFSEKDWRKDHPSGTAADDTGGSGKVTIELSDEAKRLFKIGTVSGNVTNGQVEAGAGAGVPPALSPGLR
jgi:hypothetical protein